jgi:hypothetical protein
MTMRDLSWFGVVRTTPHEKLRVTRLPNAEIEAVRNARNSLVTYLQYSPHRVRSESSLGTRGSASATVQLQLHQEQ